MPISSGTSCLDNVSWHFIVCADHQLFGCLVNKVAQPFSGVLFSAVSRGCHSLLPALFMGCLDRLTNSISTTLARVDKALAVGLNSLPFSRIACLLSFGPFLFSAAECTDKVSWFKSAYSNVNSTMVMVLHAIAVIIFNMYSFTSMDADTNSLISSASLTICRTFKCLLYGSFYGFPSTIKYGAALIGSNGIKQGVSNAFWFFVATCSLYINGFMTLKDIHRPTNSSFARDSLSVMVGFFSFVPQLITLWTLDAEDVGLLPSKFFTWLQLTSFIFDCVCIVPKLSLSFGSTFFDILDTFRLASRPSFSRTITINSVWSFVFSFSYIIFSVDYLIVNCAQIALLRLPLPEQYQKVVEYTLDFCFVLINTAVLMRSMTPTQQWAEHMMTALSGSVQSTQRWVGSCLEGAGFFSRSGDKADEYGPLPGDSMDEEASINSAA